LFYVPQFCGLVARDGQNERASRVPAQAEDTASVRRAASHAINLEQLIACLAIIDKQASIGGTRGESFTIRRVSNHVDEPLVVAQSLLPLEGRALEVTDRVVLGGHHASERPARFEIDRVDRLRCAHDLADTGARVSAKHVAELFAALTTHDDSLIVTRPLQVLDAARDWLELVLEYMLLVGGVPDAHLAGLIRRSNVETRRGVLGHVYLVRVLGVNITLGRVVNVANEHAVAVHVQKVLAFRVAAEHGERAASGSRQRGKNVYY
jgi:hypothetical protein